MALLLDTRTRPTGDRIEATNAALADTDVPAIFRYDTSRGEVGHRLDYWDLGPGTPHHPDRGLRAWHYPGAQTTTRRSPGTDRTTFLCRECSPSRRLFRGPGGRPSVTSRRCIHRRHTIAIATLAAPLARTKEQGT
jgi:hypothetical protein